MTPGSKFYTVNDRPVALVPTPSGGLDCVVFDFNTGELVPDRAYFAYVAPGSGKDVDSLTEAEFDARLVAIRMDAGKLLADRVKVLAEALCVTPGGPAEVAAALELAYKRDRDGVVADPPPPGFSKLEIAKIGNSALITLAPIGALFTRAAFDAVLGPGTDAPAIDAGGLARVSYRVAVAGAPATCTVLAGFRDPTAGAVEIVLRPDPARP